MPRYGTGSPFRSPQNDCQQQLVALFTPGMPLGILGNRAGPWWMDEHTWTQLQCMTWWCRPTTGPPSACSTARRTRYACPRQKGRTRSAVGVIVSAKLPPPNSVLIWILKSKSAGAPGGCHYLGGVTIWNLKSKSARLWKCSKPYDFTTKSKHFSILSSW